MQFLSIGSRFTLHASSPHSVALMQLRFTSFAVISLWRDLHPQECAHAGRTKESAPAFPQARFHPSVGRLSAYIFTSSSSVFLPLL